MTINIPLLDGYRILTDKYQYILAREEKGRLIHLSFHSNIQECVQSFLNGKIMAFDSTSILSLINSINSLQTRLHKALLPLKLEIVPSSYAQLNKQEAKRK